MKYDDEDQLRRLFGDVRFPDEPMTVPPVEDEVRRVRRSFLRRRMTTWGATTLGAAVIASGVAVAVPNIGLGGDGGLPVAGDSGEAADGAEPSTASTDENDNPAPATVNVNTCPAEPPDELADDDPLSRLGFPNTRQCLLETAVEHLDPEWAHLQSSSDNAQSGGRVPALRVGAKLGWTNPDEDGMGLVQVAVTSPGYAAGEYAGYGMPGMEVCIEIPGTCRDEPVPGTDEQVLVVENDPEYGWSLAVLYERSDGSMAGLAVDALFGNNSLVPVAGVGITLDQAIAFVTDPELRIDDVELAEATAAWAEESEQPANPPDYSNSEVIPAPAIRDMTDAEARKALDACTQGVPAGTDWSDFEPEFGVWIATTDAGDEPLVIATRGDTKLECRDGGASLFGTPEVKGSPYLRGAVAYTSSTLGRHVSDVALVTVQPSAGQAFEAAMKNGYWFLATAVGSLPDPVIRGYDAGGELVYDSAGEDADQCYTDPDGTEVVSNSGDEVPPLEDCLPALEWDQ